MPRGTQKFTFTSHMGEKRSQRDPPDKAKEKAAIQQQKQRWLGGQETVAASDPEEGKIPGEKWKCFNRP